MRVVRPMCFCLALPVCFLLLTGTAAARSEAQRSPEAASFARAESALGALERGLSQIERSRKLTEQLDPEVALDSYYKELRPAYEATMNVIVEEARQAEEGARTGKKAGNPGKSLDAWERQVGSLRARTEKVVQRLTTINLDLREGRILIAPELLRKMPADEVQELRQWLTSEAIRKYQALDKSLFAGGSAAQTSPFPPPAVTAEMTRPWQCRFCGDMSHLRPQEGAGQLLDELGNLLVPKAEAVMAAGCVNVCTATPPACLPCVGLAVGLTSTVAVRLDEAFDECDRLRTRVGRAICKAGVVVGFLAVIA